MEINRDELQYHDGLREFEQDQRDFGYAVQADLEAMQNEIDELRAIQQVYVVRDEFEPLICREVAKAINIGYKDVVQQVVELVFEKLKSVVSELPEVISKDDFIDALNEFMFE